jgi:hypothetical protein
MKKAKTAEIKGYGNRLSKKDGRGQMHGRKRKKDEKKKGKKGRKKQDRDKDMLK